MCRCEVTSLVGEVVRGGLASCALRSGDVLEADLVVEAAYLTL